jgi:quinone-modifying oxidoreductase, subunit QmoA
MTSENKAPASGSIVVVGGGISGLTTAIEAAEVGYEVYLIEKNPYLGGRVAQLNQYFPKLCPPTCGLEINFRRIKDNPRIKVLTMAQVEKVEGQPGNYNVAIRLNPRYVNERCTCCGECAKACGTEISDEFNFGMDTHKGAFLPFDMAYPPRYVISQQIIGTDDARKAKEACKYDAVDLEMQPKTMNLQAGAVVWATGWEPYDASRIDNLGFGRYENIITNMMVERMASTNGPTEGKILRPSDNQAPKSVVFVQCAGSRDENHLPYCSYICCMASLKQASYVREQYPDARVTIFYIDLRTPGKYEKFLKKFQADEKITMIKGKVADVSEAKNGRVQVIYEDAIAGAKQTDTFDLVVLATGMQPSVCSDELPVEMVQDENCFLEDDLKGGIFAAGCAKSPLDVMGSAQSATGAALKAIQTLVGGKA